MSQEGFTFGRSAARYQRSSTVQYVTRLCERPGCSAPAAVAYGMEADRLLVWLEIVPEGSAPVRSGVLCRRHADAMVVPRGWTLDDRRESRPRLFRVADTTSAPRPRGHREARQRSQGSGDQLTFGDEPIAAAAAALSPGDSDVVLAPLPLTIDPVTGGPRDDDTTVITVGDIRPLGELDPDETQALPWRFKYDEDDDLGGVLNTKSPLLSRAFRGLKSSQPD